MLGDKLLNIECDTKAFWSSESYSINSFEVPEDADDTQ